MSFPEFYLPTKLRKSLDTKSENLVGPVTVLSNTDKKAKIRPQKNKNHKNSVACGMKIRCYIV